MNSSPQWYMAIGGQQVGPVAEQDVVSAIQGGRADAETLVFLAGMRDWTPLRDVPKFQTHLRAAAPDATMISGAVARPDPAPAAPTRTAHEIDYVVHGEDLQFVEIELDPGESVVAEAGALMYMTRGIQMETIFGDGSAQAQGKGLMGALLGAGKRLLTGESLFMTVFTAAGGAQGEGGLRRALSGPDPGHGPRQARRRARLPEGLVPVRGARGRDRHRLPEADRRRPLRRRGLHHAAPAGRRPQLRPRGRNAGREAARARARRCASTPAAWSRSSPRSTTTSSSSAASRPRSSAARACSSRPSPDRDTSGCSRCR